jgi:upstream activation factor subunit UAF30
LRRHAYGIAAAKLVHSFATADVRLGLWLVRSFARVVSMASKKTAKKNVAKPVKKAAKPVKKKTARKPNAAFLKPVQPDDFLAAVVGAKPLPRTELTKKLWDYIKKNKLQDAKVRTQINADDKLRLVFNGKKAVSMFEMTKLVSGHLKL